MRAAPAREDVEAFRRALLREAHVLVHEPSLLWQQLHNRVQWEAGPALSAHLSSERARRAGGHPWLWRRTQVDESAALLRVLPTAGRAYLSGTCAFTADGAVIATTGRAGVVRLWDTATGALRATTGSARPTLCCAVAPDGRTVAAGHSGDVTVWDVEDGTLQRTLTPSLSRQTMRQIDRDRHAAALAGEISTWEPGRYDNVLAVAFSTSGLLAAATIHGRVSLFDVSTGEEVGVLEHGPTPVVACGFHPCGDVLVTVDGEGRVRLWRLPRRRSRRPVEVSLPADDRPRTASFSPDGDRLAVVCSHDIVVVDTSTGVPVRRVPAAEDALACAFSPDGNLLAVAGTEVELRDAATGELVTALRGPAPTPHDCAFSPDGRLLATAGYDLVTLWDMEHTVTDRHEASRPDQPPAWPGEDDTDDTRTPDGTLRAENLVTAVRVTETAGGAEHYQVSHPASTRRSVPDSSWQNELVLAPVTESAFFSPDGRLLCTVGEDDRVLLWDARDGRRLHQLYRRGLSGTAVSPDGSTLATGDTGGDLLLWDVATGTELLTIVRAGRLGGFSPDSLLVVTARTEELCLWDALTGDLVVHIPVSRPVARPRFHPSRPALRCDVVEVVGGRTVGTLDVDMVGVGKRSR